MASLHPRRAKNAGFTLIEVAIALVIASIISAGAMQMYKIYTTSRTYKVTRDNITELNTAIQVYLSKYGSLPCPSKLTAKPDDPEYGASPDCAEILSSASITIDEEFVLGEGRSGEKILIGKIPFRELNVRQTISKDGWGRDLYYAVSATLTNTSTYSQYGGVIDVVDEQGLSLLKEDTGVQYVLYSTGSDDAPPGSDQCIEEKADFENCNGDGTFKYAAISLGQNESFYDDTVSYVSWIESPEAAGECSIASYMVDNAGMEYEQIVGVLKDQNSVYLKPGDMAYMCNRRLLSALNSKNCILFVCNGEGVLRRVSTIE